MRLLSMSVRFLIGAVVCAFVFATPPARAADANLGPADVTAIHQVISDQIAAFRRDDGPKAFSYAAPMIQGIFMTPENFMAMVKEGYLPVYRPKSVEFGGIEAGEHGPVQHVYVTGPDGTNVEALYTMEHEKDGTWRINGCELKAAYQA